MYQHFDEAGRAYGVDLSWQMQLRVLPHLSQQDQAAIVASVRQMATHRALEKRVSVYDQCQTKEDRMRLIGSALSSHAGLDWLKSHPAQASWMAIHGVSVADCLKEFEVYYARESAFAGFRPARRKRKGERS